MGNFPIDKILHLAYFQATHSEVGIILLEIVAFLIIATLVIHLVFYLINKSQKYYFVSMQLPIVKKEDMQEVITQMTSIFASLNGTVQSFFDKVTIDIVKADSYIAIQLGSNKKEILRECKRLFNQFENITFTESKEDIVTTLQSIKARTLYTTKKYLPIGKSEYFYDGIIRYLSGLPDTKQGGVQIILRGVHKKFLIERKKIHIEEKIKSDKRRKTETEEELLEGYNKKLGEGLFKTKITVYATDKDDVKTLKSSFQSLNTNRNNWYSNSMLFNKKSTILNRFLYSESLLDFIPFIQEHMGSYLTSSELATLFHPISSTPSRYQPEKANVIEAPPSYLEKQEKNIHIGTIKKSNGLEPVYFPVQEFARHWYVIGKTGRGKSTLLKDTAVALHEYINKNKEGNMFIFDPHADLVKDIIANVKDSKNLMYLPLDIREERIFTVNPLFCYGFNELEKAARRDMILEIIISITKDETGNSVMGVPTLSYMKNAIEIAIEFADAYYYFLTKIKKLTHKEAEKLVYDKQLTLNDLPLLYIKEMGYLSLIEEVFAHSDTQIALYIQRSFAIDINQITIAKAAKYRLEQLLHPSIVLMCEGNSLSLKDAIKGNQTFLIPIPENLYGSRGQQLLLKTFLTMIWEYKQGIPIPKRIPTYIMLDEVQKAQISTIGTMISESRKYKDYLIMANQQLGQLLQSVRDAVVGNMGTTISFTVGAGEIGAETLSEMFAHQVKESDLLNLPAYSAYLQTEDEKNKIVARFTFQTNKPENIELDEKKEAKLAKESLLEYGELKSTIREKLKKKQNNPLMYFLGGI